jgi:hypothetical protein
MKIFTAVIVISISINAQVLIPSNFPSYQITADTNATSGQLLYSTFYNNGGPFSPSFLAIMNNDGSFLYLKQLPQNGFDFKLQPNGNYTYYDTNVGIFYEMDNRYNIIDSFYTKNGYTTDVHELQLLPNGNALLLGQDFEHVDMSKVVQGGNVNANVIGCVIQELDPFKNVIFQWRSFDHYKITDATPDINLLDTTIDYVHANAVDVDSDGNFLLSARHLDEITKINKTTGDIIWRLGGKNNQFLFTNDTIGFSHQHHIRRIANGDITMFDNGNLHNPPFSRAVEYKLDEVNKTATLIWQYKNSPVTYTFAMGSVQRLDNGNTLIGWGVNQTNNIQITEVNTRGEIVFELDYPYNNSYRAFRFNVSAQLNNNAVTAYNYYLSQNFPNPFNPCTTIDYSLAKDGNVKLTIYNAVGSLVSTIVNGYKPKGDYSVQFNNNKLASGIYIYRLESGDFSIAKKLIIMK